MCCVFKVLNNFVYFFLLSGWIILFVFIFIYFFFKGLYLVGYIFLYFFKGFINFLFKDLCRLHKGYFRGLVLCFG